MQAIASALAVALLGFGGAAFGATTTTKSTAASKPTSVTKAATTSTTSTPSKSSSTGSSSASKSTSSKSATVSKSASTTKATHKAPKAPAITPLTGWLGGGAKFPARALVLSESAALTPGSVSLSENGSAISSFSLTRMTSAGGHDFGLVFVVDQSMDAQTLSSVMAAVRAAAAQRSAGQELGLVTFAASPSLVLGPTSSQSAITGALATTPSTATGADLPAATSLALTQLERANVALGAVVVVSDGAGAATGRSGITPLSVRTLAASLGAQLVTVGITGAGSTPASLQALSKLTPGSYVSTQLSRLTASLKSVVHGFTQDYVLRYRSSANPGGKVTTAVSATGVPGGVSLGYRAPGTPPAPPAAPAPRVHHHASSPSLSGATQLSPTPSFAALPPPPAPAPNTGFWASSQAVYVVAGAVSLLLLIGLALVFYRPSRRAVRMRVGSFVPVPTAPAEEAQGPNRGGPLSALQRGTWWPPFVEAVEVSRSPHSPIALVRRAGVIAFVVAVAILFVAGSMLLALIPVFGWPFLLRFFVYRQAEKQRVKFRDMLPSYLQDLASAIRVGRSFVGALAVVGESADEPTRSEFERAVTDEALGRPLEESLEAVSRRMGSTDMDQVALIAALNRRSGANVAESLDRVAEGSRDRADLRREIKALTAQAKMSSMVLTALPGVLLLGLTVLSPQYSYPLFHTTMGLVALAVGGVMVLMGWKVMQKITRVEA